MAWTKRHIVDLAFDEVGLDMEGFQVPVNKQVKALKRLDSIVATWEKRRVYIGWRFETDPDASSLDSEVETPEGIIQALYLALAVSIAPTLGKAASPETRRLAREAYANALGDSKYEPPTMQLNGYTPRGAGSRLNWGNRSFFTEQKYSTPFYLQNLITINQ